MLKIPGPAYSIHTAHLVLRCWNPADAPLLEAAIQANLDHLRPWMPWIAHEPIDLQERTLALRHFRGRFDLDQDFVYAIFSPDESQVLGGTGLHTRLGSEAREIGYWIDKDHLGRGYATEVSAALTRVAFEIDLVQRVEIHCDPLNVRSAAVPRKLGYTHISTADETDDSGQTSPSMIWRLVAAGYPASPCASASLSAFDVLGRRIL